MESFVPRLQLNASRNTSGGADSNAGGASRLNHTAVPFNTSGAANAGYGNYTQQLNTSSSYNNTSMTNNTMSSDWNNYDGASGGGGAAGGGGAGAAAAAVPPSPIPRFSDNANSSRLGNGQGLFASERAPQRYTDPFDSRPGFANSGSRSTPGPSATRPLFASPSASAPREPNVFLGDAGRVPAWGSSSGGAGRTDAARDRVGQRPFMTAQAPREDFLNRFRRFAEAPGSTSNAGPYAQSYETRPAGNVFTSTYVGTSTGAKPATKPSLFGGVGVSDDDWRGGTRTLATSNSYATGRGASDRARYEDNASDSNGLVNSRSRARADRWTDENLGDDATSLDVASSVGSLSSSATSSSGRSRRRRHSRGRRHHHRSDRDSDSSSTSEDSDDLWDADEADPLSFADAVVQAMDAQPVVPLELLRKAQETPFVWARHPSHGIILILLQHRGIYLPRYRELVDYHMAELFLHYLDLCQEGAYFVYYAPSKWPKERFFRIRMLPVNRLEAGTEPVPHLVMTLHESGVHILDAIPLDNLVGVTVTPQAACFRPFLESPNTIIGCREGRGHRARMPVDGAFSLWFYDIREHTSRSVDILTCDAKVFDIWTKTFRGLVSVNSSSVVQVAMTPQGESAELAGLAQAAQEQSEIDHGERSGKMTED